MPGSVGFFRLQGHKALLVVQLIQTTPQQFGYPFTQLDGLRIEDVMIFTDKADNRP